MRPWYEEAIFYSIFPLGAVNGKRENDYVQTTGGMEKLGDWVGHIAGLGCNAVYFGPLFESKTHGYDTTDYRKIDSRLGTNRQFAALVEKCHAAGLRVVVDGVFNHTGRNFFAFRDLKNNRDRSLYRDWYRGLNFHGDNPLGDGFAYEAWRGHHDLPRLNPYCPGVREYLFDTVRGWINEFDIDGIRLDCADCLDFGFMRDLRRICVERKPDFWLMGEIIHGDYTRWANADTLHSVTNYECSKGLHSSHNDGNLHEVAYSLNRQFGDHGIYRDLRLYNFADNHDLNRLTDTVNRPEYLPTVYTILFTMPGIPSVYYGSEWGIRGVTDRMSDWNLRPEIDIGSVRFDDPALMEHIRLLAEIRSRSDALRHGDYAQISVSACQFAFRRRAGSDEVIVLINIADEPRAMIFEAVGNALTDLLCPGDTFPIDDGKATVPVPAHGSRVLRLVIGGAPPPPPEQEETAISLAAAPPPVVVRQEPEGRGGEILAGRPEDLPAKHVAEHPAFEYDKRTFVNTERMKVAVYELAPGKSAYPFHWHTAREELYYILSGSGLLRTPNGDRPITAGELLYFPASEKGAHRLINTAYEPLRYIDFDAVSPGDVTFYPDSRKVSHKGTVHRLGDRADYYYGE